MSDPTTRKVSTTYGAPMGRPRGTDGVDARPPRSVRLFRVRLDSGGYDAGGAYWGAEGRGVSALWCATDGEDFCEYVRAGTRAHAAHLLGIRADQLRRPIPAAERERHAAWLASRGESAASLARLRARD